MIIDFLCLEVGMKTAVVDILGLSPKIESLLDVAHVIEKGLPARSIDRLKAVLKLNDEEVATTLGLSERTINRIRSQPKKKLGTKVGDQLYRAAHIFALATSVFGDEEGAHEWLRSPQFGLGNLVPLKLLTTGAGAREVEDLLGRIEHGTLS
jgi:putative toxin-antitoxin system antitoxin component (TIGR02293 family)